MLRVCLGMLLGIAVCAIWLHCRYLPQQGEFERQLVYRSHECQTRLGALIHLVQEFE